MKLKLKNLRCGTAPRLAGATRRRKPSERGMATVVFIALLAVMLILIMVESSSLIRLHREVKLLEQQQLKRLNGPQTNAVVTVTLNSNEKSFRRQN